MITGVEGVCLLRWAWLSSVHSVRTSGTADRLLGVVDLAHVASFTVRMKIRAFPAGV
jgi:hypothetical protein